MPQIFMLIAPGAQDLFKKDPKNRLDGIEALGGWLCDATEEIFEIKGRNDTAFDAVNLFHTIGEKPIQIEIRYTVGEDEYDKGESFNPSDEKKRKLVAKIKERIKNITGINPSVWVIPVSDSVFVP